MHVKAAWVSEWVGLDRPRATSPFFASDGLRSYRYASGLAGRLVDTHETKLVDIGLHVCVGPSPELTMKWNFKKNYRWNSTGLHLLWPLLWPFDLISMFQAQIHTWHSFVDLLMFLCLRHRWKTAPEAYCIRVCPFVSECVYCAIVQLHYWMSVSMHFVFIYFVIRL